MGRRKIEIAPLTDERNRSVTFAKRKGGLMKKAYELGVLCNADVALIIFAPNGKAYQFSSTGNIDQTLYRYSTLTEEPAETKGPEDFGGLPSAASSSKQAGTAKAEDDDEDEYSDGGAQSVTREQSVMSSDHEPPPPVSKRAAARKSSSSSHKPSPSVSHKHKEARTEAPKEQHHQHQQEMYEPPPMSLPGPTPAPHFWSHPASGMFGLPPGYGQIPPSLLSHQIAQMSRAYPLLPGLENLQALASLPSLPLYGLHNPTAAALSSYQMPPKSQRANSETLDRYMMSQNHQRPEEQMTRSASDPPAPQMYQQSNSGSSSDGQPKQPETFEDYLSAAGYSLDGQAPPQDTFRWPTYSTSLEEQRPIGENNDHKRPGDELDDERHKRSRGEQ